MTKADVVREVSERTNFVREDVAIIVDTFLETVKDILTQGEHLEIRRFGTFNVKYRKPTVARNPRTGEKINVPAKRVPTFKFSNEIKNAVENNHKR